MPAQQLVKGVITTEGKILLLRNSHFVQNAGMWDLPGGMLLGKESPMQGMARLIGECLGVAATNMILRSSYFDGSMVFNQVYEVVVDSTGWHTGKNYSQAKWFDLESIKATEDIVNKQKVVEIFKACVR